MILLFFAIVFSQNASPYTKVIKDGTVFFYRDQSGRAFTSDSYIDYQNYLKWEESNDAIEEQFIDPKKNPETIAIEQERRDEEFGKKLIYLIRANNRARLTKQQRKQVKSSLSNILDDLSDGNICDVKTKAQALTPDGSLIRQAEIDLVISKIDSYKVCP